MTHLNLSGIEQLYLVIHEHQYGATLHLLRWEDVKPLVFDEGDEAWLAEQLDIDFEPDRGEHLTCFPFAEINNLESPPTVSLTANPEENG